jgi:hypothetical protein
MTTTQSVKCHPLFDKYVIPNGAQFPLRDVVQAAELRRQLTLATTTS